MLENVCDASVTPPLYRGGNGGSERLSSLHKVTQQGAELTFQAYLTLKSEILNHLLYL